MNGLYSLEWTDLEVLAWLYCHMIVAKQDVRQLIVLQEVGILASVCITLQSYAGACVYARDCVTLMAYALVARLKMESDAEGKRLAGTRISKENGATTSPSGDPE